MRTSALLILISMHCFNAPCIGSALSDSIGNVKDDLKSAKASTEIRVSGSYGLFPKFGVNTSDRTSSNGMSLETSFDLADGLILSNMFIGIGAGPHFFFDDGLNYMFFPLYAELTIPVLNTGKNEVSLDLELGKGIYANQVHTIPVLGIEDIGAFLSANLLFQPHRSQLQRHMIGLGFQEQTYSIRHGWDEFNASSYTIETKKLYAINLKIVFFLNDL
jgi:hypothetical protein